MVVGTLSRSNMKTTKQLYDSCVELSASVFNIVLKKRVLVGVVLFQFIVMLILVRSSMPLPASVKDTTDARMQLHSSCARLNCSRGQQDARNVISRTKQEVPKVLIMASYRSGSTFFSQIFNTYPKAFFMFEPLWGTQSKEASQPLTYRDGRKLYVGTERNDLYIIMLRRLFKCDFNMIDDFSMKKFVSMSRSLTPYMDCAKEKGNYRNCIHVIASICKDASVRSIKVIRLPMDIDVVQELLTSISDLQIIHLLRDPRGQLPSAHSTHENPRKFKTLATSWCQQLDNEINNRTFLERLYPQQFLQVIYEDMAESISEVAQQVTTFTGLPFNDDIQKLLLGAVTGREENGGLNVMRGDPVSTAYSWRTRLSFSSVQAIDDACETVHARLNMTKVNSEQQLRDLNQTYRISHGKVRKT